MFPAESESLMAVLMLWSYLLIVDYLRIFRQSLRLYSITLCTLNWERRGRKQLLPVLMNRVWLSHRESEENYENLSHDCQPVRVAPRLVEYISDTLYHIDNLFGLNWFSFLSWSYDYVTNVCFPGSWKSFEVRPGNVTYPVIEISGLISVVRYHDWSYSSFIN
jgi:hypothetical protein